MGVWQKGAVYQNGTLEIVSQQSRPAASQLVYSQRKVSGIFLKSGLDKRR